GSKQRIADWILDELTSKWGKPNTLVDIMSGSGSVAHAAHRRAINLLVNDQQPNSHRILESTFVQTRDRIPQVLEGLHDASFESEVLVSRRPTLRMSLATEEEFQEALNSDAFDWKAYRNFCQSEATIPSREFDLFSSYYANTYFGIRQCLE